MSNPSLNDRPTKAISTNITRYVYRPRGIVAPKYISGKANSEQDLAREERPKQTPNTPHKLLEVSKLNTLGWKAEIDLNEGIKRT